MNPSHVLLGEILINCVLPKSFPQMYAMMSLTTTMKSGNTNQIIPSSTLDTLKYPVVVVAAMIMCVHANCAN